MKSMSSRALALALSLTVLSACGSALAAEDDTMLISPAPSGIAVQLNGEALTFTDAVPVAQDGRTFLPFRAVFEAMGAEVSNEGNTITAVRDGKTLTMTIGSTEATLTEGGASSAITMDWPPMWTPPLGAPTCLSALPPRPSDARWAGIRTTRPL